jgi:transcription antitermination factor NusG
MSSDWYVLRSKPHKEAFLFKQLQAHGIEAYYPVLHVAPVNPRARKQRPFFPGYLFVHVDFAEMERSVLQWMPGSAGLVLFGFEPPIVPVSVLNNIRNEVNILNKAEKKAHQFDKGDTVLITEGPFAGYKAIFDMRLSDEERVLVLLQLLEEQNVRLSLSPKQIEKAD